MGDEAASAVRPQARVWVAPLLCLGLLLGAASPAPAVPAVRAPAAAPGPATGAAVGASAPPVRLYTFGYGLGFHPLTSPHQVREQLTTHFRLFPVSGGCGGSIHQGDQCELLGGNPVRVDSVGTDYLQIVTLPGHSLGADLRIRFAFSQRLGFLGMTVRAWKTGDDGCGKGTLCGAVNTALAWWLWRVLAQTLSISAFLA